MPLISFLPDCSKIDTQAHRGLALALALKQKLRYNDNSKKVVHQPTQDSEKRRSGLMLVDFEELLRQIGDDQKALSMGNLYALSRMSGNELQLFQEAWPLISNKRRRQIIQALVEIAEFSVETNFNLVFRFCLHDEDEYVRTQAIEGLWEDEDTALIGPLIRLLKDDPAALVRAAAATSLGRFVLSGELEDIEATLALAVQDALFTTIHAYHENPEVRRRAVESIAYSSAAEVDDIIEAAYYDDEEKMRVSAIFAMGRSANPRWRALILEELDNLDPEIRYEAARACGELENVEAIPSLAHLTQDPDREIQEAAIWALGNIGGEEARRILQTIVEESWDEALCEAAEEALEELNFLSDSFETSLYEPDDYFELE